jgi:tRNA pseudouridine38-40 synthase
MPTYRLHLEYDGTDFHGWQVQPGQRTVQGELIEALSRLCGEPVRVTGAGRTDAGVHARMQVASFDAATEWEAIRLLRAVNAVLPDDLRVWRAGRTADGFSARASALERRYEYRMLRRPDVLARRTHHLLRWAVDPENMAAAAGSLVGEHDFAAFAASPGGDGGYECRVTHAAIRASDKSVVVEIAANRFLHNMVRRLSGALVEVGRGRLRAAEMEQILALRDVPRGGPCLPAAGLCLVAVAYPPDPVFDAGAVVDAPPAGL